MPGTNNAFDIITMTVYYILYKLPPEMTRNKNRARNRGNMAEGSEKTKTEKIVYAETRTEDNEKQRADDKNKNVRFYHSIGVEIKLQMFISFLDFVLKEKSISAASVLPVATTSFSKFLWPSAIFQGTVCTIRCVFNSFIYFRMIHS